MSAAACAAAARACLVIFGALVASILVAMFFERFDFLLEREKKMEKEIALVQSKTFWAALLALVAVVARTFGWSQELAFAADPHSLDIILQGVAMLGAIGAIFARYIAQAKVTTVLPKGSSNTASALALLALVVGFAFSPGHALAYAKPIEPILTADLSRALARATFGAFVFFAVALALFVWRREIRSSKLRSFAFLGLLAVAAPSSCVENAANNINTTAANISLINGALLRLDSSILSATQQQAAVLGPIACAGNQTIGQMMAASPTVQKSITSWLNSQKAAGFASVALSALCATAASS